MRLNYFIIFFLGLSIRLFAQPAAPSLSSPANASTSYVGSTITFFWTPVTGATSYDIEFDAGLGISSLRNVSEATTSWLVSVTDIGPHTWHVRAKSGTTAGSWSSSRTFSVIGLPAIPVTGSPANGSTIYVDAATTFSWNQVANASSYQIQFDTDDPIIVAGTSYSRSFNALGNHTWKVLASNNAGNSGWSSAKTFILSITTPSLSSPASGTVYYVGATMSFYWTPVSGATSYDIELDAGLGIAQLTNVAGTSMSMPVAVANVGPHTWHVRAKNGSTIGQWSSSRSYTVVGLPAVPTLGNPSNGSTIYYDSSTNFSWSNVSGATSYKIQFDAETPMVVTGTNYVRTFNTPGNHTWKVMASNGAGDGSWSTTRTFIVSLASPNLTSPVNGSSSFVGTTVNFSWTSVAGATSYDIELDAGLGFVLLTNLTGTSMPWLLDAADIGQHTWHVRAKTGTTDGPWSSTRILSVINLPGIPTLFIPQNDASIPLSVSTAFAWTPISNATSYQLQFDSEAPIVVSGTSYSRSFNVLGSHTWKVLATNAAGNSDWSLPRTFTVALDVPALSSPANGSTSYVGSVINFSWTPVNGATSYDVEFDAGLGYVSLTNVTKLSLTWLTDASKAGPHTWHVRANSGSTPGPWSGSRTFTVIGTPDVPTLNAPQNAAAIPYDILTTFSWNTVPNATSYQIQFDAESPVIVAGTNSFVRSFSTTGTHTWKVLASNAAGNSEWSTVRTFTVALGTPVLLTPLDNVSQIAGTTINFSWSQVPGATSYDIETDAGQPNSTLTNVTGNSLSFQTVTANAGTHTWHVRAKNGAVTSSWSSSRTFTIIGIPAIPTLLTPDNGSAVIHNTAVTYTWNAVPGATGYKIQFDTETAVAVNGTSFTKTFSTLGNHTWKVQSLNSAGSSDWSIAWTINVVLNTPLLVAPDDISNQIVGSTVIFSWSSVSGATSYDVEMDAGQANAYLSNVNGTNMPWQPAAANIGPHTWRVRAKNNTTAGSWSLSRTFIVVGLPSVPVTVSPANESTIFSDASTTFSWNPVSNATGYQIRFDSEAPVSLTGITYSRSFSTLGSHSWKVLASNAAGYSDWSTAKSFTVMLGTPAISTPEDNITKEAGKAINFSWTSVSGAASYDVEMDAGTASVSLTNVIGTSMLWQPAENNVGLHSWHVRAREGTSAGGWSITRTLTVLSVPVPLTRFLELSPDNSWDFGTVSVSNSNTKTFSLKNSGNATLKISGLSFSGPNTDQFSVTNPVGSTIEIPAGGTQLLTVGFKPSSAGWKNATLVIANNSDNASPSKLITFNGTGTLLPTKTLEVNPDGILDFGNVTLNNTKDITLTISNPGTILLNVSGMSLSGTSPDQFVITNNSGTTIDLPAGGTYQVTVRYKPTMTGIKSANLFISNNSDNASPSKMIGLTGTGISVPVIILPAVSTNTVTSVTSVSAVAGGNVTSEGGGSVSAKGLCWSTALNPTASDFKQLCGSGPGVFTGNLTGLTVGTTYHVRAYATNTAGTAYGEDVVFDTPKLPEVTTSDASVLSATTANAGGNVTSDGGAPVTAKGVCWSTSVNPTLLDSKTSNGTGIGSFTTIIAGLNAGTTYHVRAYATNSVGTSYGADFVFSPSTFATVTTSSVTFITSTTANIGGNVTMDGGALVTAKGLCWSTSTNPTISDSKTLNGTGIGSFSSTIAGLTAGTDYHVRAYATNSVGTSYGTDVIFHTPTLAVVTTSAVTAISAATASGGGAVSSDGGAFVTEYGLCWNTTSNPTIYDAKTLNGSGTGSFIANITGLTSGTTYHVRAYATNSVGTAYGAEVFFTTPKLPTVTTTPATSTSATTAIFGGDVTSDGGAVVTEKGVCWSSAAKPSLSDSKTSNGNGIGSFSANITGLITGATYHIRAFAVNSVGISYGDDLAFFIPVNGGVFNISNFYQIYPNPSEGRITIRCFEEIATEVSIYSLQGAILRNYKLNGQVNLLNLNLAKGVYTIVLNSKKASGTYKLVIL